MTHVLTLHPAAPPGQPALIDPSPIATIESADGLLSQRRILLVEDEMLVLMEAEDMLADLGCRDVVAAATVGEALRLLQHGAFDAALLDLNLHGLRSYSVADALAEREIPFAFATGYGVQGLRPVDAVRPLLTKPYSAMDLRSTMANLLNPGRARIEHLS